MELDGPIAEWFETYRDELYRHALFVLRNSQDAEDAVAETFIRAIRHYDSFQERSSGRTWLWAILRNHLADVQRQQKIRHDRELSIDLSSVSASPALDTEFWEELLDKLKFQQRQVFSLRVLQGFDTHETAQILGWTDLKVRVVLHRAKKTLQLHMKDTQGSGGEIRG